ncbi:hypothetical protein CcaverHIS002_0507760 [Cutaneotrichosporon cavernicola]|uniref:Uncharacterized protein n=1 Tax=Cutaneotrichosporon cavernicola TaxID=279322 RepID=A0AA48L778_9TREE|nr:uncharacterized protein CcaverHIS019_0508330 [Cutaneotrichosporon cavernicola]BEI85375.1 hypothetical protein CcaverHIS002_0507760 [Cutaneotrichosporon cavernicola]BEI93205.1 hypothetical protein CcaverHIS019_0508330 [Cutaneotrichosporon cavernicola]BEJ00982.1 hypothetical protein CcaverHIS631_0508390 [Cutaneotrichosporon cavernicola]BEJ08748.1 hypothetical protein CcaverHIS641_0508420 [Cutaneotrichosporon cavernicola]
MSFVLAASTNLPSTSLQLLPFYLTPTPATAPVSDYFVPRPTPSGYLAAFRGRQVVGQEIEVPRGYRGVVLRAAPPPTGGLSASSSSSIPEETRSTRTQQKGAAQVALSRPRPVRGRRTRKIVLEDDEEKEPPAKRRAVSAAEINKEQAPVPVINVVPSSPPHEEEDEMAREVDLSAPIESIQAEIEEAEAPIQDDGPRDGSLRVLTPTAKFDRFTLWTPDAPLAGFRADERDGAEGENQERKREEEGGWWRRGGAGEGGDEFVRALGEWLGLNEIIHAPTYDADDE